MELNLYVAEDGNDSNPGTLERPFASLQRAKRKIRELKSNGIQSAVHVVLREGTYFLSETLVLEPEDSGSESCPIRFRANSGECVTISGGKRLKLIWKPYRDGIWFARVSGIDDFNQLFVNGRRQIRARFPNYDPSDPLMAGPGYRNAAGGTDRIPDKELIFDPDTFTHKRWRNPSTGIVHAFQSHYWGNMQYRIRDVDWDNRTIRLGEGGFQLQRSYGINQKSRFYVENIMEELDAPGEWYFDKTEGIVYFYPPGDLELEHAEVIAGHLKRLVEFRGTLTNPVAGITLEGFTFAHTQTTFLDPYEDLARGDWAIHRGGTVFLEGAVDCTVMDCYFDAVGGNGVFISGYNRGIVVTGCKFEGLGDSAVCAVGLPEAARAYQTWSMADSGQAPLPDDRTGPQNEQFPASCTISNNIIRNIGFYGKQTAGVFISMSSRITVSRNTIYEVPRAAICINDGTWGGHVIEYNDIWETVRETGEHGPFNSWGRERQWGVRKGDLNKAAVFRDAMEPVVIRHNRIANFRKSVSAGNWTIDLDDGSSHYHIHHNLCLGSTLKLRDGFYRKVENNIFVSAVPLGWHVWPKDSEDLFVRNIVVVSGARPGQNEPTDLMYYPIGMPEHPWGKQTDYNLYWNVNTGTFRVEEKPSGKSYDWEAWRELGYDRYSRLENPLFVDPEKGDYRVRDDSPALRLGFMNFPMNRFGHRQTRILPFGGDFEEEITVSIDADERGGEVWYTLEGSEPRPGSSASFCYQGPFRLRESTLIKAQTYLNGRSQGFGQAAEFKKVEKVEHPSWMKTMLSSDRSLCRNAEPPSRDTPSFEWLGARLTDIHDDDLIDALGGHNEGVLLAEVPPNSAAGLLGFQSSDVVVQWGEERISTLQQFTMKWRTSLEDSIEFVILRGYTKLNIILNDRRDAQHDPY